MSYRPKQWLSEIDGISLGDGCVPKEEEKEEPEGAPAYMGQFTALMTLLLAFFICLLTMGQERISQYQAGFGEIRDAFGLKGGFGIFQFWRKGGEGQGDDNPSVKQEDEGQGDDDGDLVGYLEGTLWREGLLKISIIHTEFDNRGVTVTMSTPIEFRPGSAVLDREIRHFLNRVGIIFFNLPSSKLTVYALTQSLNSEDENQLLSIERAAAVTRYLEEKFRIPRSRVDAIGYAHTNYLHGDQDERNDRVLFSLRKPKARKVMEDQKV